jgi:hypothetical protein
MTDNQNTPEIGRVTDLVATQTLLSNQTLNNLSIRCNSSPKLCWQLESQIKLCHLNKSWYLQQYPHLQLDNSKLHLALTNNYTIQRSLGRIICWGVFNINGHQTLLDGICVNTIHVHIVSILKSYLAIIGWGLAINLVIPRQKPQAP